MSPKRLFFILPNLHAGGAERVITRLANHLPKSEYQPTLVLFQKEGIYLQQLNDDIPIIDLKIKRIRYSLRPLFKLFKKEKPDMVFCGWGEVAAYVAPMIPFFTKIKFIARETNVISQHVTRKDIRFFYRFYKNFDGIIAQSDDMKNDLMKELKLPTEQITKINNPVDFSWIESQLENAKNPYPKNDLKKVLAVGNLTHRKGFDLLLQVFEYLKDKPIELYILGDGDDKEKLFAQKEKNQLSNVHFLGIQENPFPYYQYADLFVLSSRYEGFPNALLEANACGTFALCNDAPGGIHEIVQSQVNGEIFDIEKSELFAEKISHILEQSHDEKAIKNAIQERYDLPIIMEKYIDFLNLLVYNKHN